MDQNEIQNSEVSDVQNEDKATATATVTEKENEGTNSKTKKLLKKKEKNNNKKNDTEAKTSDKKEEKKKRKTTLLEAMGNDLKEWHIKSKKLGNFDLPFFLILIVLLVFGIIMMFSASYAWAISEGKSGTYYAVLQICFAVCGLFFMFLLSKIDYHIFQNTFIAWSLFIVCLLMLIVILIRPIGLGVTLNESTRWIKFGPLQFQPSEVTKFAMIILFAVMISHNYKKMNTWKTGILPFIVILAVVALLLMKEPHLSATILIALVSFIMIYIGGARLRDLFLTGLAGAAALAGLVWYKINIKGTTYFLNRFDAWLDPFSGKSYAWQTKQSLIAIGSGGFFGMGLGNSRQKFQYLPETKNDFVFAIVCEELGFIGALTVMVLFAFLIFRGFYIASKAPDKFGMLVCIGLTSQVGLQAFLNIAVVSNFIPNTGISLPFFSYGGTSLMMILAQMGIILNISRHAVEKEEEDEENPEENGFKSKRNKIKYSQKGEDNQ